MARSTCMFMFYVGMFMFYVGMKAIRVYTLSFHIWPGQALDLVGRESNQ